MSLANVYLFVVERERRIGASEDAYEYYRARRHNEEAREVNKKTLKYD